MNNPDRYIDQLVALLKLGGLWLTNDKYDMSFYNSIFRVACLTIVTTANGISVCLIGLKQSLKDIAIFFPALFIINVQTLTVLFSIDQQKNVLNLLKICFKLYSKNWQFDLMEKANHFGWTIVRFYKFIMFTVWLFYFILPPLVDIIIYLLGNENTITYTLPLPLTGYLDKKPVRSLKNCLILTVSMFWSTISFLGHIGTMCTFFITIVHSHSILKIFNMYGDRLDFTTTEGMKSSVTALIKMHQNIIK